MAAVWNMMLFTNNCQNDYEKQVVFKCSQKPQITRCYNNILCNASSILVLFRKVILKWVGAPHFWEGRWKNRAKCGKMVIFSGLQQGIFPDCPWHIRTYYFTPFLTRFTPLKAQNAPKKFKNCIFWQIPNSSLIFYPLPLPILGLSFKFYYAPLSGHYRS